MDIVNKFKKNRFVRGVYFFFKSYLIPSKTKFDHFGDNVTITPPFGVVNVKNVFIGPNVGIGENCLISTPNAKVIIKGNSAIAEGLTVHTGNHARVLGLYVSEITEENKPVGYDNDVIIEEDVWIGSNVTILSGVTIGRGMTVAAGAVVNKSMPPYCVAGGVPAKFIKFYWTIDQILEHESKIYPEEERYTRFQLEEIFARWQRNK